MRVALLLAATVVLLEATARWAVSNDAILARITSPHDEPSWRLRWLERRAGATSMTRLAFDQHHPERGWALAPNLRDLSVFSGKRLNSNSRGLRGAREYQIPKPEGQLRIALFGDSFTFGEEVSDVETYAFQLERLLARSHPGVEVLNFGVHGYGHDQMLLYLRETLPLYQPDIVLLGYVADDSLRNLTTFRDYAKPRFRLKSGSLVLEGTPVPPPDDLIRAERYRSRLVDLLTMVATRLDWRWGDRAQEVDELTDALLSEIAREARAAGATPVFVLLPVWNEIGAAGSAPLPAEAFVLQVAERERVACLRLRPLFRAQVELGADLEQVGHWGPREHRLAAGGIADFFSRAGLVK